MLEWERGQDLSGLVKKLYSSEQSRENLMGISLQEIIFSGFYEGTIVRENDDMGDGYSHIEAGKIVIINDKKLDVVLITPREVDLVKIIKGEDFASEFNRISEKLSEHYFSPRVIYKVVDQIKKRGLLTAAAIILSENPNTKKERITIHHPKFLSEMVGELGSAILTANFLIATPSVDLNDFKPLIDGR